MAVFHDAALFDLFVADRHDPERLATMIGLDTYADPKRILYEGRRIFTRLEDQEGNFLRYAVTEEEIGAARHDPHQIPMAPLESRWGHRPALAGVPFSDLMQVRLSQTLL